jgi:hypothetical protein
MPHREGKIGLLETGDRDKGSRPRSGVAAMNSRGFGVFTWMFLCLAGTPPVVQQQRGMLPHRQSHAVNRSRSLSLPATTQTPSKVAIGRKLNDYIGAALTRRFRQPTQAHRHEAWIAV